MGKNFRNKSSFKRPKQNLDSRGKLTKRARRDDQETVSQAPLPSSLDEVSEDENANIIIPSEELVYNYKQPSAYDKLLSILGSSHKSVANANKQRQREEEGRSDTEDEDDGSESSSLPEEVDDEENQGSDVEFPADDGLQGHTSDIEQQSEDEQGEYEKGTSDSAKDLDDESALEASMSVSSFNMHLEHMLSNEEVENLQSKKMKYKWEVPAFGMSNCRWTGTGECFLKDVDGNACPDMKPKLYKHWLDVYKNSGGVDFHSSKQNSFFTLCNSYRDILHCNKKPFYLKGSEEDSSIRDGYIMHCLNHIFKTRDLVIKNDAKIAKHQENAKDEIPNDASLLDQGFTRPKVLILLPLASTALRVVKRLIQLTPSAHKVNVEHMQRFYKEFGTGKAEENEGEGEAYGVEKSSKPSDFQSLFGGNNIDHFAIGIKFTKRSIKLFSDFYSSDIIVASALGLVTKMVQAERDKEKNVDYLSSIEVLVIDYAEVIAMQNWSSLSLVVKQLNVIPSKTLGTDIMRIRPWYLEKYARFYRQTILLSSLLNPDINAFFSHQCVNYQGKVKLACEYKGVLPKVLIQVQQIYQRFNVDSVAELDDARLQYFSKKVFPKIKDSTQGGIMIFISSYFEFVRVRNFLKSHDASFCILSEYTEQSDISRGRVWFFEGKRKIMLYTERMHFYHRYKIRGIKNLFFYSLPERKEFYHEMVNMLEDSDTATSTALFSCFDQLRLERIVGTVDAKRMVKSEKDLFVFC